MDLGITQIGWLLVAASLALAAYTFVGYPLLLKLVAAARKAPLPADGSRDQSEDLPKVSVTVPAYNEEAQIAQTVESLLRLDYPRDRLQLLIVSDGSTDRTDQIVAGYADQGVELLRVEERKGKTHAENVASTRLRGDIIVNTDASIRLDPGAIRALVPHFRDPTVGVASGRDVSVGDLERQANVGESGYVGAEMALRALETRCGGIVGASGSLYGIRRDLHKTELPDSLSRDFASALIAIRAGYRAVSVDDALCAVPRTPSLRREYKRKVRTVARGMETLGYFRALLNPGAYGRFSWMLFSHKVCRWLIPVGAVAGFVGLALLSPAHPWAAALTGLGVLIGLLGIAGWRWPEEKKVPKILAVPGFAVVSNLAVLHAWVLALTGNRNPTWEPTRRELPPDQVLTS